VLKDAGQGTGWPSYLCPELLVPNQTRLWRGFVFWRTPHGAPLQLAPWDAARTGGVRAVTATVLARVRLNGVESAQDGCEAARVCPLPARDLALPRHPIFVFFPGSADCAGIPGPDFRFVLGPER